MKNILTTVLLLFLFAVNSSGIKRIYVKLADKNCGNRTASAYKCIRGSPADTLKWELEKESILNGIKINGKILKKITDTLGNKIYVNGTGNKIGIEQKDHTSKTIISQKGKGNRISIIQK